MDDFARLYTVVVPDMRGHGRSTNPTDRFTHRQSAQDVLALLDVLDIDRVRAIGMSSGAMILLHMATQQPERIEAMVLEADTSYFPEQARAIMPEADPEVLGRAELVEARWENGGCRSRGDTQTRMLRRQFHRFKDSYDDMNFTPPYLSMITARTLIVHGDRDEFFPVHIPVQLYETIPDSYLWIVRDRGCRTLSRPCRCATTHRAPRSGAPDRGDPGVRVHDGGPASIGPAVPSAAAMESHGWVQPCSRFGGATGVRCDPVALSGAVSRRGGAADHPGSGSRLDLRGGAPHVRYGDGVVNCGAGVSKRSTGPSGGPTAFEARIPGT